MGDKSHETIDDLIVAIDDALDILEVVEDMPGIPTGVYLELVKIHLILSAARL